MNFYQSFRCIIYVVITKKIDNFKTNFLFYKDDMNINHLMMIVTKMDDENLKKIF